MDLKHKLILLTGRTAALPINTVSPAISGTVEVGQTLTASTGTWTGTAPITYTYQWKRDTVAIGGETNSTYVMAVADVNTTLTVTVTATNTAGAVSATSAGVTDAYVVYDTFTDANDTLLTAHTPELKPSTTWEVAINRSPEVISNAAIPIDTTIVDNGVVIESGVANVRIEYPMVWSASASFSGPIFRWADSSNYWRITNETGTWKLYEVLAGVTNIRHTAAQTLTAAQSYALKVTANGTALDFYVDGVLTLTYSSAANQANTKHGFDIVHAASVPTLSMVAL